MKKTIKYISDKIPFKHFIFKIIKKIWTPPESIYRHLYFKGLIIVRINNEKFFKMRHYGYQLENDIFWNGLFGRWEKRSMDLWVKLSGRASTILDIGANTGIYSLVAKTKNPNSKVYAFEPVTRVYGKLVKNVQLNNYDIETRQLALSNYSGKAFIYDTNSEHTYSVTVNKNFTQDQQGVQKIEIETKTLDDFIVQEGLSGVDLIKIDVETHEPEVLQGFQLHLFQYEPAILIEILSEEVGEQVEAILQGSNYLYFNIDEERGIRKVEHITQSDSYNFLLCNASTAAFLNLTLC
jgi:FkbM family methyltransferase